MVSPGGVGGTPTLLRQACCTVDVVPVGGVMQSKLFQTPGDAHFTEHSQVGGRISLEGIEQGPIPVEEDAFDFVFRFAFRFFFLGWGHASSNITEVGNKVKDAMLRILRRPGRLCTRSNAPESRVRDEKVAVSPRWNLVGAEESGGNEIVAVEGDVVEIRRDAVPAGHGCRMNAAHMGVAGHDHVALAQGAAHQDNLQLNRGVYGEWLRAQEIDAGGANIASDQGDGKVFNDPADTLKLQRQLEAGSWIFTMLGVDPDGVRGHANKTPR
jgi:hypothetical protein